MHFSLHLILEGSLEFFCEIDTVNDACCAILCDIRSAMVSKHSELTKRLARDHYGRFASPSSRTAPPPSCHVLGSSILHRTAPPTSSESDNSVEMWVAAPPPPPLRLHVAPPPSTHLAPRPPPTRIWECPHVKKVISYEHCF
jgi:hypothetical protein